MPTLSRVLLAVVALSASLAAQRTWIVDQALRQGADFADLPETLIVANDGDTIILRTTANLGYRQWPNYSGAMTNKAVTILGEPGARIGGTLGAAGLPSGRTFAVAGLTISYLTLSYCSGAVHVERVTTAGVSIVGCLLVTLVNSTVSSVQVPSGSPDVAVIDCSSTGVSVTGDAATPRVLVAGGLAFGSFTDGSYQSTASLTIAGGRTTTVVGNIDWHGPLTIDPTAQIFGTITGRQPTMQRIPDLSALGAPPGQPIRTSIRSPAGDTAVLLVSVPMQRTPTPPFGDLWIDPTAIFYVAGGIQGAGEQLDLLIPTPSSAPRGIVLGLQALAGPGLDLRLSNPSVVVVN